jgi:hypothetical protein
MKTATLTTLALAAIATLTASGQDAPKPTAAVQRCVQAYAVIPGGHVLLVDDDECEDDPERYVFWYGGTPLLSGGRTYLRGGSRVAPANAMLAVRHPDKGGSWRTRGRAMSHNEEVSRRLNVPLPYDTTKANPKAVSGGGDDRRQPAPVKKASSTSSNKVSQPSRGRR